MNTFAWDYQPFDTEILGVKTAKITSLEEPFDKNLPELINDLKNNDIVYATYRFPACEFSKIHTLEQHGFLMIDGIMALERETKQSNVIARKNDEAIPMGIGQNSNIRPITKKDYEELIALAGSVFSLNRFYNDPFIPKEKADNIYKKWMENSLNKTAADEVLVYCEDKILGFVTIQKNGHIPLLGVNKEARGKGIAKLLTNAALNWLKEQQIEKAAIETQTANIAALRAYMSCGFKIVNSFVTYRWKNNIKYQK